MSFLDGLREFFWVPEGTQAGRPLTGKGGWRVHETPFGIQLYTRNDVDDAFVDLAVEATEHLPPVLVFLLQQHGWRIRLCDRIQDVYGKDVSSPMPADATVDHIGGICDYDVCVITLSARGLVRAGNCPDAQRVTRENVQHCLAHEVGHAVDAICGYPSQSPAFRFAAAGNRLWGGDFMARHVIGERLFADHLALMNGDGEREVFAELVACETGMVPHQRDVRPGYMGCLMIVRQILGSCGPAVAQHRQQATNAAGRCAGSTGRLSAPPVPS